MTVAGTSVPASAPNGRRNVSSEAGFGSRREGLRIESPDNREAKQTHTGAEGTTEWTAQRT